jgi:hypothetical protein
VTGPTRRTVAEDKRRLSKGCDFPARLTAHVELTILSDDRHDRLEWIVVLR